MNHVPSSGVPPSSNRPRGADGRRSKVIVVSSGYAPSLLNFRGPLIRAMVDAGHHIIACGPEDDPEVRAKLRQHGVRYHALPLKRASLTPGGDLVWLFRFYRLLRRYQPDVLLSYTVKPVIYGSIVARMTRVPAVISMITGLGFALSAAPLLLQRVMRRLYRLAMAQNDLVFFQNPDDAHEFRRLEILRDDRERPRVALIDGSGVDLDHFAEHPLPTGAPPSETVFLLIARLIRDKGIREYVAAARLIKMKHPRTRFQIVGFYDVNPAALSRDEIDAWVREGHIEYMGEATDVRPHLRNCHVYVLPSYREGTPRTVLEAMATGRPVVTTDTAGCRETVKLPADRSRARRSGFVQGENGFLVPVKDPTSLAAAMERFIVEPELLPLMGRRSREYAEERYDVRKINEAILDGMRLTPRRPPQV